MIVAVVLAAGASTRFGAQKLIAPFAGSSVVRHAVERAIGSGVDATFVVTGADGDAVAAALRDLDVRIVPNPGYARGLSSSLAAGIAALPRATRAALVSLGDQPTIPAAAYAAVLSAYPQDGARIVVPSYRGTRGHPVLFDATLFVELSRVHGDRGARDVIARDPARVRDVALDVAPPADVDDPAALAALSG